MEERKITQENLQGTWELIDFKITKPDGMTKKWGPNPNGYLIYDKSGYMSTSINSGSDVATSEKDLEKNILFYAGKYKITGPNEITHCVTNASNPKRINQNFIRNAEITKQKQLQLTAEGDYGQAYLLWQKI